MDPNKRFEENLPLVGFIFQKHFKNYRSSSYYEDIMQEGYLALWRACLSFNESLGYQFSTYAGTSIRFGMNSYIQKENKTNGKVISIYDSIAEGGENEEIKIIDTLSVMPEDNLIEEIIEFCVKSIKDLDQEIVRAILNGHSQRETAELCNTSQATVSRCLHKFRNIIVKEIEN